LPKNNAKSLIFALILEDQFLQNASQNPSGLRCIGLDTFTQSATPHENPENTQNLL
jgi:hypothetical protein